MIDIAELRRIAEAAKASGQWRVLPDGRCVCDYNLAAEEAYEEAVTHDVVLELIERIELAEKALRLLGGGRG